MPLIDINLNFFMYYKCVWMPQTQIDVHLDSKPMCDVSGCKGRRTYMYSRCAECTAAALLYRHSTMTDDSTSSVASNCSVKTTTTTKSTHVLHSPRQNTAWASVRRGLYSRLTANPNAEALCRMMETAGKETERQWVTSNMTQRSYAHWYLFKTYC